VSAPLKAGEVNALTLVLHGPSIDCLMVEETGFEGSPVTENVHTVRVRRNSNGSLYVPFTPTRLGKVGVRITGLFSDGGFGRLESTVDSEPSDREPALPMMQVGGVPGQDIDMWRLGLDDPQWQSTDQWFHFWSSAYYLDSRLPAEIDRSDLHFAVKQPQENPVIELSDDGGIRPLRAGDALLETTFGNTTRETCIQVTENSWGGDNSRCGRLRATPQDAPLQTVWSRNPDGLASQIGQFDYFVSRISLTPPDQPVELAQPLNIPITVTEGKIRFLTVRQKMKGSDASILWSSRPPSKVQVPGAQHDEPNILRDDDEPKVIELVPVALGEETVSVAVEFKDGGFDERYFHIKTVPSDGGLEQIELNLQSPPNARPHLTACLKYSQVANCIFLPTLEGLRITVDQPGRAVVRIDPDGTIHELSVGTATVSVGTGSVQQSTPLHVSAPLIP
jgi:hypothetical protein